MPAGDGVRGGTPRTKPVDIFVTDGGVCAARIVPRGPVIFVVMPAIIHAKYRNQI